MNCSFLDAYERDSETDLDVAEARYFSSKQGRFTSPDPFLGSAETYEPQSWNRYTFALNNPLFYIDPTGLIWVQNNQDGGYYWIPDDKWEGASGQTFDNGRQLYTPLKPEQFAYDSKEGRVVLDPRGPNPDNPSGFTVTPQVSAAGVIALGALGTSQIDSPAPGPADVVAIGLLAYAEYVWMTQQTHPLPIVNPNIFTSGDRDARKVNQDRSDAAKEAVEKLRDELAKLKSTPNKTPDIKAKIKQLEKAIKKQLDRMKKSETHAKKSKGS